MKPENPKTKEMNIILNYTEQSKATKGEEFYRSKISITEVMFASLVFIASSLESTLPRIYNIFYV
jgi:hypothetical protein